MDSQKIFTLKVMADELALIERALSGLVPVQVRQPNDTISLLQQSLSGTNIKMTQTVETGLLVVTLVT